MSRYLILNHVTHIVTTSVVCHEVYVSVPRLLHI